LGARLGFDELAKKVVESGACTGCSACVITCPYKGVLEYSEGRPKIVGECKVCGICPRVCPRYALQREELETFVFGRARKTEEDFGVYREIHVAKSTDEEVLRRGQDGGVATALICSALDSGIIDGAVVSGVDTSVPWLPVPFVATSSGDVLRFAGTRYTYSLNLLALSKCVADGLKKVAFVGTPCQIMAFRRIQKVPIKRLAGIVAFTVGLFCSESFTYEGLMLKKIRGEMGIDLKDIAKMNIKGKMLLTLRNGGSVEIPLKEAKNYAEGKCGYCGDFSAEFADISLGGVGLDGRTFTVVRTEAGKSVFDQALKDRALDVKPVGEFKRAYDLLVQLSKLKRKNMRNIV